jgi:hypothetical protein
MLKPPVDNDKPKTTVRVVFWTGKSTTLSLNLDAQVSDVHTFVRAAAPTDKPYALYAGYPPRIHEDNSTTIADAKLQASNITQRLVD